MASALNFPATFPDTSCMAAPSDHVLVHSSFYRFVRLKDAAQVAEVVRELVSNLTGNVLLAEEGISGALAGTTAHMQQFEHALQHDARLEGAFLDMPFKHSACRSSPFWKVRVQVKPEIVALRVPGVTGLEDAHPAHAPDTHISPLAWRELITQPDVVVLDNRNSFEYRLGRFKGAIDPLVDNFRDFPSYVETHAEEWKQSGKKVAMYCTGGIRCEKTSHWMQSMGLEVYQLDGGIVNFFQALPDADRDWEGECFVFDNRVAIDTRLQETATTAADVYNPDLPDERWRLERAQRLDSANPKVKLPDDSSSG